jgi:U3 small nucleolar RNA-associated protein 14
MATKSTKKPAKKTVKKKSAKKKSAKKKSAKKKPENDTQEAIVQLQAGLDLAVHNGLKTLEALAQTRLILAKMMQGQDKDASLLSAGKCLSAALKGVEVLDQTTNGLIPWFGSLECAVKPK